LSPEAKEAYLDVYGVEDTPLLPMEADSLVRALEFLDCTTGYAAVYGMENTPPLPMEDDSFARVRDFLDCTTGYPDI
jgi:hypothetical protein